MTRRGAAAPLLAAVALLGVLAACGAGSESEVRRFESPDGRFAVVVLRRSSPGATAPGQAGDAPGLVRLVDREGHVLAEAPVEMVQLVDDVRWSPDRVDVKLVAEWKLPAGP